jgi:phytoene dehydrogenase-like protein
VPTNFYDVIVLGDDLAGLIGATLCARRGMRVLVAETVATPPDWIQLGPYALPRTPMCFVGDTSPAHRRVVAELNFIQSLKRRLSPMRPSFQIILPDGRIEVSPDADALGKELDRELPLQRAALEAFLARAADVSKLLEPVLGQDISLPAETFWERRELARYDTRLSALEADPLPGVPDGHPARALIALPAAFSTGLDPRAMSPVAQARAFDLWRRGAATLQGGAGTLRQMLLDKLRTQHAGEVRTVAPAHVVTRWGRAHGLQLRDGDELLGTTYLMCGSPVAEFGDLFGDKRPRRLRQIERGIRPTAYRFVLHLVVSESGIPEGIAPVSFVVVDPSQPLLSDNAFAIYVGQPDDDARVLVTVVANAPAPGDGENLEDLLAQLRPKLRRRLEDVMPFSSEHTLLCHSPNQARPPEGLVVKELPSACAPEPLWSPALPCALGVGAVPYHLGIKHVVTACAQNLPGLGLEGDFTAGFCAARLISSASGKRKDYLKDEVLLGT